MDTDEEDEEAEEEEEEEEKKGGREGRKGSVHLGYRPVHGGGCVRCVVVERMEE